MARVANKDKLDAKPLLRYIEQRGGKHYIGELASLQGGSGREHSVYKTLQRIEAQGWVGVLTADDLLTGLLNTHPYDVYGNEWWTPTYWEDNQAALDAQAEMDEMTARLACVEAEFNAEKEAVSL